MILHADVYVLCGYTTWGSSKFFVFIEIYTRFRAFYFIFFFFFFFFCSFKNIDTCCILTSDPAELSDEKCTCVNDKCIRSNISGDNLDCRRVELSVNCDARKK